MMKFSLLGLLLLPMLFLVSCGGGADPSGFLGADDAKLVENGALPFDRSYRASGENFDDYDKVEVVPVNAERLRGLGRGLTAANTRNVAGQHRRDAEEFAAFATQEFETRIQESSQYEVVADGGSSGRNGTLIFETALVELIPGRPSAQIVNFFFPFAGLLNRPTVAMEGRFRDSETGETVFAFADRETAELSLLDTKKFSYYGVSRREVERWAGQVVQVMNDEEDSGIRDPFFIQPVAW